MKRKEFGKLNQKERKEKLFSLISNMTRGRLSKNEIESIVDSVDIEKQYKVVVIKEAKEFNNICTLADMSISHSWAGGEGREETAEVVFGSVEFGRNFYCQYSQNGNITTDESEVIESNFDVNKKCCVLITSRDYNEWINENSPYDRTEHKIVIYAPEKEPYKFNKDIQYILDKYEI